MTAPESEWRDATEQAAQTIERVAGQVGLVPDGTRLTMRGIIVYAAVAALLVLLVLWLIISLLFGGGDDAASDGASENPTESAVSLASEGSADTVSLSPENRTVTQTIDGTATVYGPGITSTQTANGDTFDPQGPTAAHPSIAFGTEVRVTNPANGLSGIVTINDRLPDATDDRIDLTVGAGQVIGITVDSGPTPVTMEVLANQ